MRTIAEIATAKERLEMASKPIGKKANEILDIISKIKRNFSLVGVEKFALTVLAIALPVIIYWMWDSDTGILGLLQTLLAFSPWVLTATGLYLFMLAYGFAYRKETNQKLLKALQEKFSASTESMEDALTEAFKVYLKGKELLSRSLDHGISLRDEKEAETTRMQVTMIGGCYYKSLLTLLSIIEKAEADIAGPFQSKVLHVTSLTFFSLIALFFSGIYLIGTQLYEATGSPEVGKILIFSPITVMAFLIFLRRRKKKKWRKKAILELASNLSDMSRNEGEKFYKAYEQLLTIETRAFPLLLRARIESIP